MLVNGSHTYTCPDTSALHSVPTRLSLSPDLTGLSVAVDLWFIHLKVVLLDSSILINLNAIFNKPDEFSGG